MTTPELATPLGQLPRWNLSRHFGFNSPFDPLIDQYVEETRQLAIRFREKYEGRFDQGADLYEAIVEVEMISQRRALVSSFLRLSYDIQLDDDALKKRKGAVSQLQKQIQGDYLDWFKLDVADMSKDTLDSHCSRRPELSRHYSSYLDELRRQRPHNLDKAVERALTVRSPYAGIRPTVSFFEKELTELRFELGGKEVNMEVLLSRLSSSRDAQDRANCLAKLNSGLGRRIARLAAFSLNCVAGSWLIENKERSYKNIRSRRNSENNCPDEVVNSLLRAVRSVGVPLCKRYYAIKKKILNKTNGLTVFRWSDRNAPIEFQSPPHNAAMDESIPWSQAVEIVERGYRKFSPRMADMFLSMVNEQRIDAPAVNGKRGGAYCEAVVPGVGPFQLLNFDGTQQAVAALAHESGHGCHDMLAAQHGYLQCDPPLTIAETASMFGEMIVFQDLLELAKSPEEKLVLVMSKADDVINSVVRQCCFDRFEELVHNSRNRGELSSEELDAIWMQSTEEYYGKVGVDSPFDAYDDMSHMWSYITHFHHAPFYVYSYAFADLVVGTLYHSFQTSPTGFEDRFLTLLSAGGTLPLSSALQPFGLDPNDELFWEDALRAHLGVLVGEAEKLSVELGG